MEVWADKRPGPQLPKVSLTGGMITDLPLRTLSAPLLLGNTIRSKILGIIAVNCGIHRLLRIGPRLCKPAVSGSRSRAKPKRQTRSIEPPSFPMSLKSVPFPKRDHGSLAPPNRFLSSFSLRRLPSNRDLPTCQPRTSKVIPLCKLIVLSTSPVQRKARRPAVLTPITHYTGSQSGTA